MSDTQSCSAPVPDGFICPISLEVMRDPVMNRKGLSYERKSIMQWLYKGNAHCPLTREPLRPSQLVPNNALKVRIRRWSMEHGVNQDSEETSNHVDEEGPEKYSAIEELGVLGIVDLDEHPGVNGNVLAGLDHIFDQVLEITSSD